MHHQPGRGPGYSGRDALEAAPGAEKGQGAYRRPQRLCGRRQEGSGKDDASGGTGRQDHRFRERGADIIHRAEERSRELYRVANTYTEDALRRTEEAIQAALSEVQTSRSQFRSASQEQMQAAQDHLKQQETPPQKPAENK